MLTERQRFEEKIADLENKLQAQQAIASTTREDVVRLTQQAELLETSKNTAIGEQQATLKKCQKHEKDLHQAQLNYATLHAEHDKLSSAYNKLVKEGDLDKAKNNELSIKSEKSKERIVMLESALKKAEDSLKDLGDKHLFLTQEKTELAFQLKQILAEA